ncbi:aminoglycoside phosphotransferase family protein [Streptomyces chengbuensis]|uniref:phosphotransferase family protein n=1 Tax=Streptomyces TaxID=1883 RepID=UPI0025B43FB9|nr:aminoglycoside phosphotransferase family protein [Streptomyces sp. HUAS CB01]WJY51225.1 aminoglycoside phosphotransferase family protein [Streptomyces sp. HUAS CB01]
MGTSPTAVLRTAGPDGGALARFVREAARTGETTRGHHNRNHIAALDPDTARLLGRAAGERVTVRRRMPRVLPVVIRTWPRERLLLDALKGVLPHVPEVLAVVGDAAVHTYVEGVPLSGVCEYGKPVDPRLVEALAPLLAGMYAVPVTRLPKLPAGWPRDGASRSFLRTMARLADEQIRQPNWAEFGGLFVSLGVPEDALRRFADRIPPMTPRPFTLLHTDLHRDNVILRYYDDGGPPLVCVDWELATYGDPLHDLATHLVRMRYPSFQEDEVVEAWGRAMTEVRPEAAQGTEDLRAYLDFERAQSVFPDVMRAARGLGRADLPRDLHQAAESVRQALAAAQGPLRLPDPPGLPEIEQALYRWHTARLPVRPARVRHRPSAVLWQADVRVPERTWFPWSAVTEALGAEGAAPAGRVFRGTGHLNTVVDVESAGARVVVRRKLNGAARREPRLLDEHAVLLAVERLRGGVRAPRILALGYGGLEDQFAVHSYEGPAGPFRPPEHPVQGLRPQEADDLVDQLVALAAADTGTLGTAADDGCFHRRLSDRLVGMVASLPADSRQLARALGLPGADRLKEILDRHTVTRRTPVLLHGDLNPWNLVRSGPGRLTVIDWELAMVGDPLYDLVRHLHLTPHRTEIARRMYRRWALRMGALGTDYVEGWEEDVRTYRWIEVVRSAYLDLDRLVNGADLHAPNVRRAVDSYAMTLGAATDSLGLRRTPRDVNPFLYIALPEGARAILARDPDTPPPEDAGARQSSRTGGRLTSSAT